MADYKQDSFLYYRDKINKAINQYKSFLDIDSDNADQKLNKANCFNGLMVYIGSNVFNNNKIYKSMGVDIDKLNLFNYDLLNALLDYYLILCGKYNQKPNTISFCNMLNITQKDITDNIYNHNIDKDNNIYINNNGNDNINNNNDIFIDSKNNNIDVDNNNNINNNNVAIDNNNSMPSAAEIISANSNLLRVLARLRDSMELAHVSGGGNVDLFILRAKFGYTENAVPQSEDTAQVAPLPMIFDKYQIAPPKE